MLKIYAIKDVKVGEFQNPFYQRTNAEAVRSVTAAVNAKEENHYTKFYNDYELWCLGTFNMETGEIISKLEHVANCADLKEV